MPLGQGVHLLGVSLLLGAAVLLYPRMIGRQRDESATVRLDEFLPFLWLGFALILVTGLVLFAAEPVRMMRSPVFLAKMGFVLAALGSTLWLRHTVRSRAATGTPLAGTVRVLAATALTLWFVIAASGRLIGYWRRLVTHFLG
jgi:hypothetical protein